MKPYYDRAGITLYHGDCREVLPELSGYGLVVTDPPYTFGMASTMHEGKAGGWGDMMNGAMLYAEVLRLIKPSLDNARGAAWLFNSWRSFPVLMRASFDCRWPIESLMIWDKQWIGPGGPRGLRPAYEVCALFVCDGFSIQNRSIPDVWACKWHPSAHETEHPAEKPVELLERIIRESKPVGPVLDPFSGAGSTLVASLRGKWPAIGIEIEERWCEATAKRIDNELAQGDLFVKREVATNG